MLGLFSGEMCMCVQENTYTSMLVVAQFVISPNWKQPKYPLIVEWTYNNIHSGTPYSKENQ